MTEFLDSAALRKHYSQFLTAYGGAPRRILLTGHSHQAWPDVARAGQDESFTDAVRHVDDKWSRVFAVQDELRAYIQERLGGRTEEFAFASNTHELVARFLSALDLRRRKHLVTTSGEFHSLHRQLRRLAEEGIEITFVEAQPVQTLAERLATEIRDDTAAVLVSSVLFETSSVVPNLRAVAEAAIKKGAEILIDAYHAWHVLPFHLEDIGGEHVFVVAGGYKYAQWGEGACFLRVPSGTRLRPVYTGWFAGFAELDATRDSAQPVGYEAHGASRFAGSTFDPASFYRARAVTRFARAQDLSPARLRKRSLEQTKRIQDAAAELPDIRVATPRGDHARGGFVSLETPHASALVEALRKEGIYTDSRGTMLRLGPAPYILNEEIDLALDILRRLLRP